MTTTLDADRFLEDLTGKHARNYAAAIAELFLAIAKGGRAARGDAKFRLERIIRETMGTAEVLGASMVLRRAAGVLTDGGAPSETLKSWWITTQVASPQRLPGAERPRLLTFADSPAQTILPRVTFEEAVQDMIDRTPATIRDAAQRTARNISKLYSEGKVTAFVRSAEHAVTERVQGIIREAIRTGAEEIGVGRLIKTSVSEIQKASGEWTEAYARMAFRTNVNTAVTAGRFRQAQDPDIKAVIPAFRFDSVGDADTRDNHDAADGLIFKVDNPVWNQIAPPLGYNCRCQVSLVGLPELRRMGRIGPDGDVREDRLPASAFPDEGFRHGGRPDLFLVGVAE